MPAVHRRDRKKAKKAVRSVYEQVTIPKAPIWLLRSHKLRIKKYFNDVQKVLVAEGHVTDDDDEWFLHALVGETFTEQCLSLDLPEFMEDLAIALHDYAVRMKKLLNKRTSEMRSVLFTYANKLVEYLCYAYPQYNDEIGAYFLTGLFCKYEEEYGDDYEEW